MTKRAYENITLKHKNFLGVALKAQNLPEQTCPYPLILEMKCVTVSVSVNVGIQGGGVCVCACVCVCTIYVCVCVVGQGVCLAFLKMLSFAMVLISCTARKGLQGSASAPDWHYQPELWESSS